MSDIYMRIIMAAQAGNAISVVNDVAKSLGSGGLGNALGNLAFGFRNLGTEGTIGVNAITQGLTGMGKTFLLVGGIATVALAGIAVALGVNATKAAGDFEAQTERLVTSAGELQSNLGLVRSGLLQMSVDTATSTAQLSAGMYYVESSGYRAGAALTVLGVAARGAKSENADLDIVSKALTTTMVDYHMASGQASDAMNGLIATVQNGKTNLQDLSASMGAVLPIASSLGISFPQVAGAMDTMTNAGMSAHQASMNLAHVLVSLSSPSSIAVKSMKEVGLSAQGVKDALTKQGLPEALQQIEDAVGKKFPAGSVAYETALKNILGGMVGLKLAAQLTGGSLAETKANIDKISGAMQNGHGAVMGWNEVQSTFNFKMDQAKQALGVFMIQLGTKLLPIFTQLMSALLPVITGFLKWVTSSGILQNVLQTLVNVIIGMVKTGSAVVSFFKNNEVAMDALKATLGVLAVIIGVAMVVALYNMAAAAFVAMIPFLPLIAVIVIIIAVVTAVILIVQHWGQIAHWLQGVWGAIAGFFQGLWNDILAGVQAVVDFFLAIWTPVANVFSAIWNGIVTVLKVVWNIIKMAAFVIFAIIVDLIILPFLPIIDFFRAHWAQIQAVLVTAWNAIKALALDAWGLIKQYIITPIVDVMGALQSAWNTISKVAITAWNMLTKGIQIEWNRVVDVLQGPINTVMKVLDRAWTIIRTAAKIAWKNLTDDIGAIFNGVVSGIKWVINQVINVINGIIHGINNISSHVGIPAIPEIPHLASGGILTRGGLVEVGERGAETVALPAGSAVYPHGSGPAGAGGPMTIINISISTMARSQSEVNRLVDMVEQEIGKRFRANTAGYASGGVF